MPRRDYRFVPVTRDDLPMLHRWLTAPHVAAIWGDPDDEIALIEGDLEGSDTRCHIVHADGPIGYVQDWCPHRAGVPHFADAPAGSRAVDTFLGETACLGQGHAKAYVRRYAERLIARGARAPSPIRGWTIRAASPCTAPRALRPDRSALPRTARGSDA